MSVQKPVSNNEFMLVPDVALFSILTTALDFIKSDYNYQVTNFQDEKLSYLYYLTNSINMQRVDVFKEAKSIFLNDDPTSKKRITINLGWPQTIKEGTNVTITHPGEQYSQNALGVDESPYVYEEFVYSESTNPEDKEITNNYRYSYGRRYQTNYKLIITGLSTNEILIVYNIFKSILISFDGTGHLNYMGFQNVKITGQDMEIRSDIIKNKWAKSINITFEYEFRVPDTNRLNYWNGIIFNGIARNE